MSKHSHQVKEKPMDAEASNEVTNQENVTQIQPQPFEETISRLEQELSMAEQAKEENYNRMLRIQADFDNYRRRSKQEYEQICMFAGEELMKKILPVIDSLERAINCFSGDCPTGWQEGVQLTYKQFQDILKSEGLEPIPAENSDFDPQVHEAISQEESGEVETTKVIAELQKGYKYRGRVIRPALVKVAIPG